MTNKTDKHTKRINKLFDAEDKRFPNRKFVISVFKTAEEIETKVLTDADVILYTDEYTVSVQDRETREWHDTEQYNDFFIVKKREGQTHIRYCDVIDTLIENDFERKGRHKFMECITQLKRKPYANRNKNSIPIYSSEWGS